MRLMSTDRAKTQRKQRSRRAFRVSSELVGCKESWLGARGRPLSLASDDIDINRDKAPHNALGAISFHIL